MFQRTSNHALGLSVSLQPASGVGSLGEIVQHGRSPSYRLHGNEPKWIDPLRNVLILSAKPLVRQSDTSRFEMVAAPAK